jgi:hypothetical protein
MPTQMNPPTRIKELITWDWLVDIRDLLHELHEPRDFENWLKMQITYYCFMSNALLS